MFSVQFKTYQFETDKIRLHLWLTLKISLRLHSNLSVKDSDQHPTFFCPHTFFIKYKERSSESMAG